MSCLLASIFVVFSNSNVFQQLQMAEALNSQSELPLTDESTTKIRDLCDDVIAKAREYTKAFQFRTEP
jgi:patatin-like phospholipase/acyl hydrolase